MNNKKAKVAEVDFGFVKILGLLVDGKYAFGVSQLADFLGVRQDHSSRDFKSILGKDFQFAKAHSELNPKPVNILYLDQVKIIIRALDKKWNQTASNFIDACLEESLERRFDKAFDKQRSEEEYNARMKARMEGKIVRRTLTDAIKDYIARHQITGNKATFYYKQVTDKIYEGLTGIKTTKKLREKLNVPLKNTPRDYVDDISLEHIKEAEALIQRMIDFHDTEPLEATDTAIKRLLLKNTGLNRNEKL